MTPEEIAAERQRLQGEIDALEAQIAALKENTGPVAPDKALGRLSRLDEMNAKSVNQATLQKAQVRLRELKYQLATVGTPLAGM